MTGNVSSKARFGPYEVDLHTHELWKFGTRLKLVGQPFEILAVLLSRPGELVTRDELRTRLWPADTFVDFNHGLNAAVNKLREALSDSADNPRYVETLPRRGYRFIAAIEWLDAKPTPAPSAVIESSPAPGIPDPSPEKPALFEDTKELTTLRPWNWRRYAIGAAASLTLLLGTAILWHLIYNSQSALATRTPVQRSRPLTPLTGTAAPSFSPDGNSVAFYRRGVQEGDSGIVVAPVGSDQFVQLTHNNDDCCPVWSPDGRLIAFSRFSNRQITLHIVPSDGGAAQKRNSEEAPSPTSATYSLTADSGERTVDTNGVVPRHGEIDWSPDGKSIAFSGGSGIYLLSLDKSGIRRLTEAPPMAEDWGPAFSPDGRKMLFVRNREIGTPDEIWVTTTGNGEASRILSERGRIVSPPQWSYDGRAIIFASNRTGHPALWRASLDTPDSIVQIDEAGSPAWDPVISRRGYRLAYERLMRSLSIWQMDISDHGDKQPRVLVSSTSDTDQGPGPQFSPDGKKLAYMSDRTGTMEIWVSNRDGSAPFQLTSVAGAGTPRWSPDSQTVAFDTSTTTGSKIISISLRGGAPQMITQDSFHSVCPSWSHDGKWIYFASPRSGNWQVWKIPAAGGAPVQITQHGGHAPLESADGKFIYYAKTPNAEPEVWRVPVGGGEEIPLPLVRPGTWASFQAVQGGILFVGPSLGHQAVLSFYDQTTERSTTIAVLNRTPFWLGATPDGHTVAFDQPGQEQDQAMLVDNFR